MLIIVPNMIQIPKCWTANTWIAILLPPERLSYHIRTSLSSPKTSQHPQYQHFPHDLNSIFFPLPKSSPPHSSSSAPIQNADPGGKLLDLITTRLIRRPNTPIATFNIIVIAIDDLIAWGRSWFDSACGASNCCCSCCWWWWLHWRRVRRFTMGCMR